MLQPLVVIASCVFVLIVVFGFLSLSSMSSSLSSSSSTPPSVSYSSSSSSIRRRLSENDTNDATEESFRMLYIVTSSSMTKGTSNKDRWTDLIVPVILDSVESLQKVGGKRATVDVYLILAYTLPKDNEQALRRSLSSIGDKGAGLEIWNDATPFVYNCKQYHNEPSGIGMDCKNGHHKHFLFLNQTRLQYGSAQLARQHRLVVKDKIEEYDLFLAFEDDMLITNTHVEQHLKLTRTFQQMKQQASETTRSKTTNGWRSPLSKRQIERLRPGFIRVEVLQEGVTTQPVLEIPVDDTTTSNVLLDPSICCNATRLKQQRPVIRPQDVMIWETGILGLTVRKLSLPNNGTTADNNDNDMWVALLPGPGGEKAPGYYPGNLLTPPLERPWDNKAKYLAQSAGWMATPKELMELHVHLCDGGFLPPFDLPNFARDGLHSHNVEFWSGGIQLSCGKCLMTRVIPLMEFDKHLLYHTSNNKQHDKDPNRFVRAQTLLAQLTLAKQQAQR